MNAAQSTRLDSILDDVIAERHAQHEKWGVQTLPNGTDRVGDRRAADVMRDACDRRARAGILTWRDVLAEEYHEALAERDPGKLRAELIQVAAVCAAWVDNIDRTFDALDDLAELAGQ